MRKLREWQKSTFFDKFAYIKKKQYLCTVFRINVCLTGRLLKTFFESCGSKIFDTLLKKYIY